MKRLLQKNSDFIVFPGIIKNSCAENSVMHSKHVVYIRTLLKSFQAGIKKINSLIKNLSRQPRKNLGSFMPVSSVPHISII